MNKTAGPPLHITEGDICKVDMWIAKTSGVSGSQYQILKDIVRQGDTRVVVSDVRGDYATVYSHGNPVSRMVGSVNVPVAALRVVGHTASMESRVASRIVADIIFDKPSGFDQALSAFIAFLQKLSDDYYASEFPSLSGPKIDSSEGGRYVKIIKSESASVGRSVHSFIDKMNGDILKPAGWNAPAKHARGNIFNRASWQTVGPYGPAYLR